jgi:hypothetical protein
MDNSSADSRLLNLEAKPDKPVRPVKKRANMHEGIAVWCDCCSCEAEPYWVEIGKEMGIDMSNDYEDEP